MYFCEKCENMYYVHIDSDTAAITHFCRNCGNTNNSVLNNTNTVYEYDVDKNSAFKLANSLNQYTKYDPTLPRSNTIVCPNKECPSVGNSDINNEIVYIKYDEKNIKFIYLCCNCDKSWYN